MMVSAVQLGILSIAGGFIVPGEVSRPATHPGKAPAAVQQQETQNDVTQGSTAGQAGQDEGHAVWRELAEELRQIPQLPEESVQGVEEADSGQGLLQSLRQAAGREDADAAAEDRVRGSKAVGTRKADKKGIEKQDRPVKKQTKTQASGFDPHLMLSRLAQPVTKLTAKVSPGGSPKWNHMMACLDAGLTCMTLTVLCLHVSGTRLVSNEHAAAMLRRLQLWQSYRCHQKCKDWSRFSRR